MSCRIPMVLLLVCSGLAIAGGDPEKGKISYGVCLACHGPDGAGNPALHAPALAGQEEWYLLRQIKKFKEGLRGYHPEDLWGKTMLPMMNTLADQEAVANVVAYIKTLKPKASQATIEGDATKGREHFQICGTCHGEQGRGLEVMNGPGLALQQDWYMVDQIKNFRTGMRGTQDGDITGMQMAPMSKTLPDEQAIRDVVAYIKSLSP